MISTRSELGSKSRRRRICLRHETCGMTLQHPLLMQNLDAYIGSALLLHPLALWGGEGEEVSEHLLLGCRHNLLPARHGRRGDYERLSHVIHPLPAVRDKTEWREE